MKDQAAPANSRRSQEAGNDDLLQIVSFRVGDEEFGLNILAVQEIIRHQHLTRVPNSQDFVDGVINLRGKVIPVIALRKRFGIRGHSPDAQARIVVLEIHETIFGLIVDSVPEVLRVPASALAAPPRLQKSEQEFVSRVARLSDRLLLLLDIEHLLPAAASHSCLAAHT